MVNWVTNKGNKEEHIAHLMRSGPYGAIVIKVFDRIDNMNDNPNKEKTRKGTEIILAGLKERNFLELYNELNEVYKRIYGN